MRTQTINIPTPEYLMKEPTEISMDVQGSEQTTLKTTYSALWTYGKAGGGTKSLRLKEVDPNLSPEETLSLMQELTTLKMLRGDEKYDLAYVKRGKLIQKNDSLIVDHVASGALDQQHLQQLAFQLGYEYCQSKDIVIDDLEEEQLTALFQNMLQVAQRYYQPIRKPQLPKRPKLTPQQERLKKHRFKFEAGRLPNLNELNRQNPLKNCAMIASYYWQGGDRLYTIEAIRVMQMRQQWSRQELILPEDYRLVVESIFGKRQWTDDLLHHYQTMKSYLGGQKRAEVQKSYQTAHRLLGLRRLSKLRLTPAQVVSLVKAVVANGNQVENSLSQELRETLPLLLMKFFGMGSSRSQLKTLLSS